MVLHRKDGRIEHRQFSDLTQYLNRGDLLVVNDTRVIPARIFGRKAKTGGKVEILLLEDTGGGTWDVLLHAARRPREGSLLVLGSGQATAVLLTDGEKGRSSIRIASEKPWLQVLEEIGVPPLPPYIRRKDGGEQTADRDRYQTIYAEWPGAVAAPTAGLHFTREVFQALEGNGVRHAAITLHVGLGTFRPVDTENVEDHQMEPERYMVAERTAQAIEETHTAGGRVFAVGSTTVRTLETVTAENGRVTAGSGRTGLFIRPPYTFRVVDAMLTNFHLPRSTLLMMISALAGRELILRAYGVAIAERYRFYSYGDCMLIV
jgi:S-adenosylmethionine:tRNA ribosyltransferase-isomerase